MSTPKITFCEPAAAFGAHSADERFKPEEGMFARTWSRKKRLVIKKFDADAKSKPRKRRSRRPRYRFSNLKNPWAPDDAVSIKYPHFTVKGCGGEVRHWLVKEIAVAVATTRCPAPDCNPETHTVCSEKCNSDGIKHPCLACGAPVPKNKRQFCSIECRKKNKNVAQRYTPATAAAIAEILRMDEEP